MDPRELVDRLLRTADAYEAEAAVIRAGRRGGRAVVDGLEVRVSTTGLLDDVRFPEAASGWSAAQLGTRFRAAHEAAVDQATRAAVASTPAGLRHPDLAGLAAAAGTDSDGTGSAPGLSAPASQPTSDSATADLEALATGRVEWPAGIPDGPPAQVVDALRHQVQQLVDRTDPVGPELRRLRGSAAFPARRPTVRAEVGDAGVPLEVTFTAAAPGTAADELGRHVLVAVAQARRSWEAEVDRLWLEAGLDGTTEDRDPTNPEV